jgi:hypothetical protein
VVKTAEGLKPPKPPVPGTKGCSARALAATGFKASKVWLALLGTGSFLTSLATQSWEALVKKTV